MSSTGWDLPSKAMRIPPCIGSIYFYDFEFPRACLDLAPTHRALTFLPYTNILGIAMLLFLGHQ